MNRSLAALLLLVPLLAAPRGGPVGSNEPPAGSSVSPIYWYATGPSNFAAAADIAWPGDAGTGISVLVSPSIPGAVDRGWWNVIKAKIQPPGLVMPHRNNSNGGYTACNYINPYCCLSPSIVGRIESCTLDDAAGDAECNAHQTGATCERSNTHYLENPTIASWEDPLYEGINTIDPTVVTFAPGPNECTLSGTTVAEIIDTTRDVIDAFLAYGRVEKVYLHKGISWHQRLQPAGTQVCKDLWEDSCTTCTNTFEDLIAEYPGTVQLQAGPYTQIIGQTTMSGEYSLWEMYTADQLHENIFGWYLVTIPDMLRTLGISVTDTPPTTPSPVVDSVTSTTATISLAAPVTDANGDTLTCLLWAHQTDTTWLGGYKGADRVHNGWNVCKQKNGGTPCTNCGDASSDTDCNTVGSYTDADAAYWLTPADAPVVPDGAAEGAATMPDFFEIACDGLTPRTIHGLTASTEYRLLAIAWPTIVRNRTDKGIIPSQINDVVTFTTAAP